MSSLEIKIQINLAGITNRVQLELQKVTNLVAIGLRQTDAIQGSSFEIPGSTSQNQFNANNPWTVELAKSNWETWILRNGFRDAAEVVAGILEEARSVLSFWDLAVRQRGGEKLSSADLSDHKNADNSFHRKTLPQKTQHLDSRHGFQLDSKLERQVRSINAARNCLVHRSGIVAPTDTDATGSLIVEWTGLTLFIEEDGREIEIVPPHLFEQGAELYAAMRPKQRVFQVGEHVVFSPTEFSEICWTTFMLAQSTAQLLEAHGRKIGISFPTPEA